MYQIQLLKMFDFYKISTPGEFGVGNALIVSLIGVIVVLLELALLALCIVLIGKGSFRKENERKCSYRKDR